MDELAKKLPGAEFEEVFDATGKSIIPGLVDGHTHPVFAGDRVHEFAMKLAGATYIDIHKAGGGIGFTVRHTREAAEADLVPLVKARFDRALKLGTTLIEAKSGYGLETDTELKMLRVINTVTKDHEIESVQTFLGAHSVPKGKTADEATQDVIHNQLPALKEAIAAGEINATQCDVFCEKGVFTVDQTREILKKGMEMGLAANFHGDELTYTRSGELAGELKARAVSHCEMVSAEGMSAMAEAESVAVLLPTTAYILRIEYPPARKLIEANVPVAIATDFNPNAHCMSMPFVMHLSCVNMRMTMNESLVASTINAAKSIGCSATHGSLEANKAGDFLVVDANNWQHLIYELGDPQVSAVYKAGKKVVENGQLVN
eukprot:TRINITY_DN9186_c0_g1_i1.p1 TRINITY_DN9186_c0_g1~~TRINITY_DN9186_c0_g1_i1.p1  ORF type:complete len:429 (-),score=148.66 TRINITY_DN9186_c0_g1_i1:30-1154(-)